MASRVEVSVVVPTFNGAAYLDECLQSIAAQDLRRAEVLVSDDDSIDATVEIARSYADRIERLRVEQNPRRLGAVGNVNHCLRSARGQWVKPVFQDDTIEPGSLEALLGARRRGVPVVVGGRRYRFEAGVPDWQREACGALLDESLNHRFGSGLIDADGVAAAAARTVAERRPQLNFVGEPVAVLLHRRTALRAGGFDGRYVQLWDYELLVRLAMRRGLVLVDEPVATFRIHGESETARNLGGSAFASNVADRLRLLVAYAAGRPYVPVRRAAARREPPLDLTALAVGSSWAARRMVTELPEPDQPDAATVLAELAAELPANLPRPWAGSFGATKYAVELLHELSNDVPAAVEDLFEHQPLAVDLAPPQPLAVDLAPPIPTPPEAQTPAAEPTSEEVSAPTQRPGPDGDETQDRRARGLWRSVVRGANAVRAKQWWNHMLGPIVAFAYLQIGWRQVEPEDALPRVLALVWSAVALAAYGYLVNDASDVDADGAVGKPNSMTDLRPSLRVAVVGVAAVLGALPWLLIPLEAPALVVLAGLYLLPLAYSPRPLRLKERHLLGPVADASNAFVLPSLFTIALFAPLGDATGPDGLMSAGAVAWASGFGLRAILLHQVADAANDRASGTATLVTVIGEALAVRLMRRVLFPIELVGIVLLAATVATWAPWLVAAGATAFVSFHAARLRGVVDRGMAVTTIEQGLSLYWTQIWPALAFSLALAVDDWRYLSLTGVVVLLFWPRLRSGLGNLRRAAANERLRRSRA